jgi:site-specific DNA-cytosine methylase
MSKPKVKVLDLFAGCGGLSYGFEMAGFEVVAANDLFPEAAATHQANHPSSRFFLGSITDSSVQDAIVAHIEKVGCDVIVGGPPCQAYSVAGRRDVDDERGHLFEQYVEMVRRIRPKFFVMENVKGILSMQHDRPELSERDRRRLAEIKLLEARQQELRLLRKRAANTIRFSFTDADARELLEAASRLRELRKGLGSLREKVVDKIVREFASIGYRVEFRLLNAADFGVPQRRERVVFIGSRDGGEIRFPEPTHVERTAGVIGIFDGDRKPWVTTAEAIGDLIDRPEQPEWNHEFTRHSAEFAKRLQETMVGTSVYGGYADAWYRQPPDEPARTVKENHGGVFVHYDLPRVMTPRELARLQSFPDEFRFVGPKSKVLVQIGNAVPPLLGKAVAEAIKPMLAAAGFSDRRGLVRTGHS